ncbi:MAG: hypothetical protein H6696_16545 [Deferribacteres bacterium]|nr:hypothetical protein [Deferribacteres bacterium]
MWKKGWFLIMLLAFVLGSTGCDKIKSTIKKGKNYFVSKEDEKSSSNNAKEKPVGDTKPGEKSSRPIPEDGQEGSASYSDNTYYRNEPVTYYDPQKGQYALMIRKFKLREECEDFSRILRRERINNYIAFDPESKKYMVLTGKYVSRSQAEKQISSFAKMGYEVEVYAAK